MQARVAAEGAVVAEAPIGATPMARHFPSRNRIIAGLSLGVAVIEATAGSGSLITARFAADRGREVFAAPGSPLDPRAAGTNRLLRDGANWAESAADIIEVLAAAGVEDRREDGYGPAPAPEPPAEIGPKQRDLVLGLLDVAAVPVDEVIRECQLSPPVVAVILLEAELAGLAERHPGNRVSRRVA